MVVNIVNRQDGKKNVWHTMIRNAFTAVAYITPV